MRYRFFASRFSTGTLQKNIEEDIFINGEEIITAIAGK